MRRLLAILAIMVFAGNPLDQSKSTISGTYAPADGTTSSSVTIILRDVNGNTLSSQDRVALTSSDATTSFNPSTVTLDGSGVIYTQMKSSHVGYMPITVNDTTTSTQISGSMYFYTPGSIPPSSGACLDSPPGSTVKLLSTIGAGDNAVTLTWAGASNPVTYYLVSYGVSSGNYIYGNPNVGGQGTTSYTVGGLTTGTKYYFVVRAGNGCTPGAYSNELFAAPGVIAITPTLTPTATPQPKADQPLADTPTATPSPKKYAPSTTPIITEPPGPIATLPPLPPQQSKNSSAAIAAIVGLVSGILIFAGIGVWVFIQYRRNRVSDQTTQQF